MACIIYGTLGLIFLFTKIFRFKRAVAIKQKLKKVRYLMLILLQKNKMQRNVITNFIHNINYKF